MTLERTSARRALGGEDAGQDGIGHCQGRSHGDPGRIAQNPPDLLAMYLVGS